MQAHVFSEIVPRSLERDPSRLGPRKQIDPHYETGVLEAGRTANTKYCLNYAHGGSSELHSLSYSPQGDMNDIPARCLVRVDADAALESCRVVGAGTERSG